MSKKTLTRRAVIPVVLLAAGVLGYLFFGKSVFEKFSQSNLIVPFGPASQEETKTSEELLLYEDEAGFSFQHPASLGVIEKDVNNPAVYSSLELSGKSHPGEKLVVKIEDTTSATIEQWLKEKPQSGNLLDSTDSGLAGMKGKSLRYDQPKRTLILVINEKILYYLEAPDDRGFWEEALKTVSSSFELTETTGTTSGGGAVIEEEEEIVE